MLTHNLASVFKANYVTMHKDLIMVNPSGLEPLTSKLGILRSIQMSYGSTYNIIYRNGLDFNIMMRKWVKFYPVLYPFSI